MGLVLKGKLNSITYYPLIFMVLVRLYGPLGTTLLHNKVVDKILSCNGAFAQS